MLSFKAASGAQPRAGVRLSGVPRFGMALAAGYVACQHSLTVATSQPLSKQLFPIAIL